MHEIAGSIMPPANTKLYHFKLEKGKGEKVFRFIGNYWMLRNFQKETI